MQRERENKREREREPWEKVKDKRFSEKKRELKKEN